MVVVKDLFLIFPLAPMDAHQLEEEEEEEEVMLDQANLEAVPQIAIKGGEEDSRVEEHDVSAGPSGLADRSSPDEEQAGSVEDVLLLSLFVICLIFFSCRFFKLFFYYKGLLRMHA